MRVILYTKDFNEKINEPVNIILSPQYYWIKKIEIPINSLKDAKKISKSMFKLDENSYFFDAFETEGKFFAYAIDKNLKLKIDKKYINSIRLAQSELYKFDKINVSEQHSIQKIEDLLFCFPRVKDGKHIDEIINQIKLSKNTVNIYNKIHIDKSVLIYAGIIFILLNSALLSGYFKNIKSIKTLENKKEKIRKKYNLPLTTFQLNSILSNLKNKDSKQIQIRKNLAFITNTPLKKNEKFTKLAYKNGKFDIKIKTDRNFDIYFKKKFKLKSELQNGVYKAELYE